MSLTLEQPTSTVIDGVSWATYLAFTEDAGPGTRITYDNGRMEIMPPISMGHGDRNKVLTRLLEEFLRVANIQYTGIDVVTLQREDLLRACEGDQMYYVRAQPPPPGTEQLDLSIHNPPDLIIEVDLSSASIDKEPLYAAFGVAELWRLDGDELRVRRLSSDKAGYADSLMSGLLPELPVAALADHVHLARELPQPEVVARWRKLLQG
jgi:Uma2 family endonuclease